MKILLIGGTGVISTAVSELLLAQGHTLYLLNRGHAPLPVGAVSLRADIHDMSAVSAALGTLTFDVVANFIAFNAQDVARDLQLLGNRCAQYIFISSASVYQKPARCPVITEATPIENPYWTYSQEKIAAENFLRAHTEYAAAITIVRPSHTYCEKSLPLAVKGNSGPWSVLQRIQNEQPVLIHGDGSSLWTITHSSDFAAGFCGLVGNDAAYGETVQITADEVISWNALYTILADALGKPLHAVHVPSDFLAKVGSQYDFRGKLLGDKATSVLFDNTKLKRLVPGFHAEISAQEGLSRSVAYLLSHPNLQRPDPDFDNFTERVIAVWNAATAAF